MRMFESRKSHCFKITYAKLQENLDQYLSFYGGFKIKP